jgi:hypothetical protein
MEGSAFELHTSFRGTSGGPLSMSAALVPGLILLVEPLSILAVSPNGFWFESATEGLLGPICTSVKGGGEGRRGELEGETPLRAGDVAVMFLAPWSPLEPRVWWPVGALKLGRRGKGTECLNCQVPAA